MKKSFFILVAVVLAIGFILPTTSFASTDSTQTAETEKYKEELSNLTDEEVSENFKRIDRDYDIGEVFSLKDQTFVQMYAEPVVSSPITAFASKKVSGSRTVSGMTVKINGTLKHDINNILNQSFGASNLKTRTTKGYSKIRSIKTTVRHTAYGLIGSGGIGKVYSGSLSTSGKNSTLNGTKRYTAVVAYANTEASAVVNYSGGTFTVNAK